jgi:pimeloyl-ACP methyl ester carboxylesterase
VTLPLEGGVTPSGIPYVRGGSGSRHAVILLGASSLFRPLGPAEGKRYARLFSRLLPDGYRFTILGYAEHPAQGHTLDAIAGAVAETISAEGSAPVACIGVSFGGFVALRLAAQFPGLVDKLVLLIGAHRFSNEGRRRMAEQIRLLREDDLYGLLVANAVLFRRPWLNWLVRLRLRLQRKSLRSSLHDPRAILRSYERQFSSDLDALREDARRVRAQTLIVGGTADQFFDRRAFEETASLIPSARLVLVPGETHMLPIENTGSVARALKPFLDESGPTAGRGPS